MSGRVLVAYASRSGSTRGVAEAIGKTLEEGGLQVDVLPVESVVRLDSYQAAVIGSAIQGGEWLPEALEFVQTHREQLRRMPCAVFLVCMTLAMPRGEEYRSHVSSWLEPARRQVRPASEGLFAGALDLSKIKSPGDRIKFRLSVLLGVWKEGDHRNWQAVRAWAQDLPARLALRGA